MITIVNHNGLMDVRDLQVFLSVAKHLNYTRAAEEVKSQSTERLGANAAARA